MAKMYPEFFPGEQNSDNPEYEVFETLRSLPAQYSVFYSKKFKGGTRSREECEVDFIIFDGSSSLLVMEVKGGLIEYDGPQDQWTQNGNPLKTGPERQASANTHSAIDFLGPMVSDINVGWCICFPNCSWPANAGAPSGVVRSIIIDEAGLLEVARSVDFINTYYKRQFKREGCTKRVAGEIINKLTRGIGFVRQMGTRIAKDSKQLLEVTQEQFNVLEDLAVNPRMAIKGYAGSGKTLLAQEFARRKLEQGKSVLLLFFNRMIVNKVRYGFDRNSRIDCQTFHSFARARIAEVDPGWWNEQEKSDEEFWNTDVPLKLADINIQEDQKYDTIIVDEGQDFKRSWFETLELYLTDTERASFIVFYDENQDVFKHWEDLPWRQAVARKVLTKNCRNTKKIVGYLKAILNCDMKTFEKSPEGTTVVERKFENQPDMQKQLVSDVNHLLKQGVAPGQIVLIIDGQKRESCIADLKKIGKHKIEAIGRTYREDSDAIRYTNIRLFKGLEADVVFILDFDQKQRSIESFYTRASRASVLLYVYESPI